MSFSVKCEDTGTTYTLEYCTCRFYSLRHVHSVKLFQELSIHIPSLLLIYIFINQKTYQINNYLNTLLFPRHSGSSIKIYTTFAPVKSANKR